MKTQLALLSAFLTMALAIPACAHPGHEPTSQGYLAFWRGVSPKAGASFTISAASPDIWRTAFISKYRIIGAQLPTLVP